MPISKKEMAANYGWSYSFLKSNPELWKLFNKAVKKNYSPQRFVAELRNTKWYKRHGESWRKTQVLKKTDPGTYNERWKALRAQIRDQGVQLGADIGSKALNSVTNTALWMDWNESQIRNALARYIDTYGKSAHYGGEVGAAEDDLRTYAYRQGVRLSDKTLRRWLGEVARQDQTTEDYKARIQELAERTWTGFESQIKAGMTVAEIAEPYMQTAAQVLELDPAEFDLFNPTIRRALQYTDPDTKEKGAKPLWRFETDLRKDPRWLSTNNARESMMTAGRSILADFGFSY